MPGRLVDLGRHGVQLPDSLIVDTSLVVAGLNFANRLPTLPSTPRATRFFDLLRNQGSLGLLTSVVAQELFHVAIRELFRAEVANHHAALAEAFPTRRRFDWLDLFKVMPGLLDTFSPELERLRHVLALTGLKMLQPHDLAPLPSGHRFERELLRMVSHYRLDTNDAAILLDAQRAGVMSIATLDADLRRAQLDFDVYTWL
ncbi:MAG: PIN domain-containing protein [Chloroflexia bacterium]|nr:PIN domain-containing protein [Chloroflexia bacterium]